MIALNDLYYFTEVAKAMSFRHAAAATGVPVSTLSRRVSALEAIVGFRLFHRTTRKVELTDAGRTYFERCKGLVDQAQIAHDSIQDSHAQLSGSVRVTLPVDFATAVLPPLLVEFSDLYPDLRFELDLSSRQADLVAEPFDLAIRIGKLGNSTLMSRRLCSLSRSLYAAPSFLAHSKPGHPSDLLNLDCVITNAGGFASWTLDHGDESVSVAVRGRFIINNATMVKRLAIMGQGVAMLADAIATEDVAEGRLARVLPDWSAGSLPVYALTESRMLPVRVQKFVEFLKERLSSL